MNLPLIVTVALGIAGFIVVAVFISFFGTWLKARLNGAPVSVLNLLGMRLGGVPYSLVVEARITRGYLVVATAGGDLEEGSARAFDYRFDEAGVVEEHAELVDLRRGRSYFGLRAGEVRQPAVIHWLPATGLCPRKVHGVAQAVQQIHRGNSSGRTNDVAQARNHQGQMHSNR